MGSASGARDAFYMEAEEINPKGQFTSRMFTVGDDGRDGGTVSGVNLAFDKRKDDSQLRITWATNLRIRAHNNKGGVYCNWELRIDGRSCEAPTKIGASMHSQNNDNDHYPATMMGECAGFDPGQLTIDVAVTSSSGADCYTGWTPSPHIMHSLLEVQESPTIWTIVFQEEEGSGNGVKFDNHPLRTLSLNKAPFDVSLGNYRVRMEWGEEGAFAEFTVPPGQNI